jgi:hypothetical protein
MLNKSPDEFVNNRNYCLCCGSRAEQYGSGSIDSKGIIKSCSKEVCVFCLESGCPNCFSSKLARPASEWHEGCGHDEEEK